MATYEINYKSDFTLVMGFTLAGVAVPLPVGNFRVVFRTQEYGTEYECSRINGEYVNCQDNGNDTLLCIFDRHGLRPGALRGEVFDYIPDTTFPDGSQLVVTPSLFDIELVEGAGNTSEGVTAEVVISVEEVVGQARDAALAAENAAESANAAADSASDAADRANDAADAATEAIADLDDKLAAKQDTLVSGQNIKTINNLSLLGSGNIDIQGGGGEQVQSDWTETDSSSPAYIKNKPTLATVATSGSYTDLTNKPIYDASWLLEVTMITQTNTCTQAQYNELKAAIQAEKVIKAHGVTPNLGEIDLMSSIGQIGIVDGAELLYLAYVVSSLEMYECRVYSNLSVSIQSVDFFDGNYNDLYNKPNLATVATSGSYNDLTNKPTIPAAQVNADWDAASGVAAILNKPTIPDLATYCPIIEDTRSSAVAAITGVAPFSTLVDGQRILLHLAYSSAQNTTLQLTLSGGTTTAAIPVSAMISTGTTRVFAGLVKAGWYVECVYNASENIWYCNTVDTNTIYSAVSQSDINTGTNTTTKLVTAKLLVDNFEKRRTYVDNSADASVQLSVTTYNDLGTLSAWKTITLPASYDRADEFVFRFVCNDASLTPTLPSGVTLADNFDFSEMAVGVVFQVSICDGIAAYLVLTPNS